MDKFWVIVGDVYKKNIKSFTFLIMLLIPFVLIGLAYVSSNVMSSSSDVSNIGLVSDQEDVAEIFTQVETEEVVFERINSKADAEEQLNENNIDAFLVLAIEEDIVSGELFSETSLTQATGLTIEQLLSNFQGTIRAQNLNLTAEQVASLSQSASLTDYKVSFNDSGEMVLGEDNSTVQMLLSITGTILLFIFIVTYSGIITQEIASEKGTRIMEIILSSTSAQSHFYGKLVGILLVALTQIIVYIAAFAIGYQWIKEIDIVQSFLSSLSMQAILGNFSIFLIIFVILGIIIYSVFSAVCGSLVSKSEDSSKAVLPVTYIALIGYMLGISLGTIAPHNIIIRVTSYVPFLSSFIMPIRLANDTVDISGAIISVLILVISTAFLTLVCARMYKSNVLIYNDNGVYSALKQSFRLMSSQKRRDSI